jgi:peptidyl-prolyl cis-trans isomerase C
MFCNPVRLNSVILVGVMLASPLVLSQSLEKPVEAPLAPVSMKQENKVLVTVNGEAISARQITALQTLLSQQAKGQPVNQKLIIDEIIQFTLLVQAAEKQQLHLQAEFIAAMEQQRKNLLSVLFLQELSQKMASSEEELKLAYQQYLQRMPEREYRVSYLLVKEKSIAEQLLNQLNAGVSFTSIAAKHSIDPSKQHAGDLGWVNFLQLDKKLVAVIETLKTSEHSQQPIKSDFGWQIVQLQERRQAVKPEFETLRPMLEEQLKNKKMAAHLETLKSQANIVYP